EEGHHHRRHQVRIWPGRQGPDRPDRRSPDRRFVALLAGGLVQGRHVAAVVRQAVRARLPRDSRLEQGAAGAEAAGRGDQEDIRKISRGAGAPDGEKTVVIGIVMGSTSDWETMKAAAKVLEEFGVPYEAKAMSAHRTPHAVAEWATNAQKNGKKAIIAAAG